MTLQLFIRHQSYRSHARAAQAYINIFLGLPDDIVTVVDDPDVADISYLHMEPNRIAGLLNAIPSVANTYKIGYCVWESDRVPATAIRELNMFDEVWTASFYNWRVLSSAHKNVWWIPHITGDAKRPNPAEVHRLRQQFFLEPGHFVFLFVGKSVPRKNIEGLSRAFYYVHQRLPQARLVVKTDDQRRAKGITHEGPISFFTGDCSDEVISALYGVCDVYVSAHRSEGWGLTISDAVLHNRLCVATEYSGNQDFLTAYNSLPVACTIAPMLARDRPGFADAAACWAYPHQEALESQMLHAYTLVQSGEAKARIDRAARDLQQFDARHVRCLIRHRLRKIAADLKSR